MKLVLVADRSHVKIHTFAEGLFSRLAHDLELGCKGLSGSAERTDDLRGSASIDVPIRRIDVNGTLKHGRVDLSGLSSSERADVLEKMRREVFHTNDGTVHVEATLVSESTARVSVTPPKGRKVERSVSVKVASEDGDVRVSGALEVSLTAIGGGTVKGPMNAFRVKDGVAIHFDVVFVPA